MTIEERLRQVEDAIAQMQRVQKGIDSNTGGWDGSILTVLGLRMGSVTPGSTAAAGVVGTVTWDNSFVYVRTNAGWKRAALSTF
jgi:hypothetical protein